MTAALSPTGSAVRDRNSIECRDPRSAANASGRKSRACGAITLADVLRRHGKPVDITSLWTAVASRDPFGHWGTRSHRLAELAQRLGLQAAVLQCREPRAWEALALCLRHRLSVILNHQTPWARGEGHYTRLTDLDDRSIAIEDPILRQRVRFNRQEFLNLWRPNLEAGGFVLIAISEPTSSPKLAHQENANPVSCPRCLSNFSFMPEVLFQPSDWTPCGLWQRAFCLGCDAGLSPPR